MSDRNQAILYNGGHKGPRPSSAAAPRSGAWQVTLSYEGHVMEYSKGVEVLSPPSCSRGT